MGGILEGTPTKHPRVSLNRGAVQGLVPDVFARRVGAFARIPRKRPVDKVAARLG